MASIRTHRRSVLGPVQVDANWAPLYRSGSVAYGFDEQVEQVYGGIASSAV